MKEFKIIDDDCVQETDVFKLLKAISSYTEEVWKIKITVPWATGDSDTDSDTYFKYIIIEKGGIAPPLIEEEVIKLYVGKSHGLSSYEANRVDRLYVTADMYGVTISGEVLWIKE